jgi:hypothetical protein
LLALAVFAFVAMMKARVDWVTTASIPLLLYLLCVLVQTAASSIRHGFSRSLAAMPLIVLTHIFYGLGFWRGLSTRVGGKGVRPAVDVALEQVRW